MKFSHITLLVRDVAQAIAFYEKAFGFTRRFIHDSGLFAELELDGVGLHFAASEAVKATCPMAFETITRPIYPLALRSASSPMM